MKDDSFEFGGVKMTDVTHKDCKEELQALEARLERAEGLIREIMNGLQRPKLHLGEPHKTQVLELQKKAQSFLAEGK